MTRLRFQFPRWRQFRQPDDSAIQRRTLINPANLSGMATGHDETRRRSGRGSRSAGTEEHILAAAEALLMEGLGLARLGLTREAVSKRAGVVPGTYDYHFGPTSARDLRAAVFERFRSSLLEELERNREGYELAAEAVAQGSGSAVIRSALLRDLASLDAGRSPTTAWRQRFHHLALALCDLEPEVAGVDYQARLKELQEEANGISEGLYDLLSRATGRGFVAGVDRTQRAIDAYLKGVAACRRFGKAPPDDEVVDTVLRLFYVTTTPTGGADIDLDAELFGREPGKDASVGTHTTIHRSREPLYEDVALALEALEPDDLMLHCALHNSLLEAKPPPDPLAQRIFHAQRSHIRAGGRLRRVAHFTDLGQLEEHVEWIRQQANSSTPTRIESRALIMDAPPALSPVVAGHRLAALGREAPGEGRIVDGLTFTDPQGIAFCEATFNSIWGDAHSYPIASPAGINRRGLDDARRRLSNMS
jgi:AcrR family transcriptional regulator